MNNSHSYGYSVISPLLRTFGPRTGCLKLALMRLESHYHLPNVPLLFTLLSYIYAELCRLYLQPNTHTEHFHSFRQFHPAGRHAPERNAVRVYGFEWTL
jgi:hypothetical protein